MDEFRELTADELARAMPRTQRKRIMKGDLRPGDVAALRRFLGLSEAQFSRALGIGVHTLRDWDQSRRCPEGPALALLKIAARHPGIIVNSLSSGS